MKKNIYIVNQLSFNEFFNAPEIVHLLSELPWNPSSYLRLGEGGTIKERKSSVPFHAGKLRFLPEG